MAELVYGARLESVYTPKAYQGFESLSLRKEKCIKRYYKDKPYIINIM